MLVRLENLWRQYVFPAVQNLAQLVYRLLSPLPEKARLPVSIISGSVLFYALMVVTNPKTKTFEPREQSWDVRAHKVVFSSTIPEFKSFGEVMAERNIFLRALVDGEVISVSDDLSCRISSRSFFSFSKLIYSFAIGIIFPKLAYSFDLVTNFFGSKFPEESSFSKSLYLETISLTFCRGNIN